ncbi:MAG: glycosyltransferase family 2 protein [Microbacterium sp.]|uniref:glycosyltransferase family 2 protein n=1 Tax=Microbacterium sp. TaxID=51671 RepID=UPI0027220DC6|nr:glycosyltransferase family 2 protein [Microbacterium sp.]MDO8383309.1 glycosyltransferase family 2 protein [Microbacterium sp.]
MTDLQMDAVVDAEASETPLARGADAPARPRRKRQWGTERGKKTLPAVHSRPSNAKLIWGRVAIWVTITVWALYMLTIIVTLLLPGKFDTPWRVIEAVSYLIVVSFLMFSALMYLVARQGAYQRFRVHRRAPRAELDRHFSAPHEVLTVLVPSYAEEPGVVRKTMWSAALQEYPAIRVVLLLDDNPNPTDPDVAERLNETRGIGQEITDTLEAPARRFTDALAECAAGEVATGTVTEQTMLRLFEEYDWAVQWLRQLAAGAEREDHTDDFFVEQVLEGLADDLETTAVAVVTAIEESEVIPAERVLELFRRLVWIFSAELTYFERKRYVSLSHEANKAMNLNSYIGLLGGRFREQSTPDGVVLRPATGGQRADLDVPYSEFVLTLDADSVLLRDYCLRLVHFLEQPQNLKVAVTQTPYSSFRDAPTRIERLAGATTDVQHILHQGMTAHNATFWVGANAVIRMEALDDILEIEMVDGFEVRRYVQDRTVIEDTESSVDLGEHGWTLINYPERLSYSATPPDFGSLVVQRRRWANGGLLILPKLWKQMRERRNAHKPLGLGEVMLRVNYMASIAWASFGLVFLLIYPYDNRLVSPLVLVGALPYFLAMASDLHYSGYKRTDIFRIYGFNLIMLPVNLAGVFKSIQQGLTGQKIPFARTPKVKDRTSTQLIYVVFPYLIVFFSAFVAWRSFVDGAWGTLAFSSINAVLATWAILAYMGIWNSIIDVWFGLTDWMWIAVDRKDARHAADAGAPRDWRATLHDGHAAPGVRDERALVLEKTKAGS